MHAKRLITSLVLIPFFYYVVMYLPPEGFFVLLLLFTTIAAAELYTMSRIAGLIRYWGIIACPGLLAVYFFSGGYFMQAILGASLVAMTVRLFSSRRAERATFDIAVIIFGFLYLPGLMSFQIDLVRAEPGWIVLLCAAVWGSDGMAYYVGKGVGRRKLYPEISPNKTVEGAVGSLAGGVIGTVLVTSTIMKHVDLRQTVIIGLVIGLTTVVGDLVESMIKRDAGVKDSGSLIPGHGGILDKLDGFTFAAPALYWVCSTLNLI